jgi:hypothetical protein
MAGSDAIHRFGNHIDWNESFYFNFYDIKNDICGFMRIGLRPNHNEKTMFCYFLMPDGSIVGSRDSEPLKDLELSVRGLRYKMTIPEKRWTLGLSSMMSKTSGPSIGRHKVSFALEFESINKMFDYRECASGSKENILGMAVAEHVEQFGRVKGSLVVGDKEYNIEGLGERDHSWGVRDWVAPTMWIWLSCECSDKYAFNLTKLIVEEGVVDAGFIHKNDMNIPIVRSNIETTYDPDGDPLQLRMTLFDKDGRAYGVSAEVMRNAKIPFTGGDGTVTSIMHEGLARYTIDRKIGYGIVEFLTRGT